MSSEGYHESADLISEHTKDLHRAIVSLMEELEAIDWYQQRADACSDNELRRVLVHNKNEEVEHAMMTLEWLRRNDSVFAANIGTYLNSSGAITEVEAHQTGRSDSESGKITRSSLGIGSLRGAK